MRGLGLWRTYLSIERTFDRCHRVSRAFATLKAGQRRPTDASVTSRLISVAVPCGRARGLGRLASALPVNEYLTTRPEEDGPGWRGDPNI